MKAIILVPILVVVAAGILVGLLATQTWSPEGNPFQTRVKSVENAVINLLDTKAFQCEGGFSFAVKESGEFIFMPKKVFTAILNFTGEVSNLASENPEVAANINLDISGEDTERASLAAEVRVVEEDAYLKVNSLSGFFSQGAPEGLEGQWLRVALKDEGATQVSQLTQFFDVSEIAQTFTDIKTFLRGKELFNIDEHIGKEEINGNEADHYSVSVNKEALKKAIPEYLDLVKKYIRQEERRDYEEFMEQATEGLLSAIDEFWGKIGGVDLEVWIARRGGRLSRIKLQKAVTEEQITGRGDQKVVIEIDLTFGGFNKKVDIAAPEGYGDLEELFIAPTRRRAKDARIVSALAQSRTMMVFINANEGSYDNFSCQQIDTGALCEDVIKSGGEMKIAKDKKLDSGAACIYSKLTQKENYWYCADSTGKAGYTSIDPGQQGHCLDGKSAVCPPVNR